MYKKNKITVSKSSINIYLLCQKSYKSVESFILKNANQKPNQHVYKQFPATLSASTKCGLYTKTFALDVPIKSEPQTPDLLLLLLTLGRTRKVVPPPVVQEGGSWNPSPEFFICCSISKLSHLQWKAFDLLNKMRCILQVVALLEASDVTKHGRHLGFYQELESGKNPEH